MTSGVAPWLDRVVIGVDFGEPALAAARWVAEQFAPGAELVLVHALSLEPAPLGAPLRELTEPVATVAREFGVDRLRGVAEALGRSVRVEVGDGRPARVISNVAHACGADLIVVGPHDGRAERSHGIGSTAERLVRISSIPVLVTTAAPGGRPQLVLVPVDDVELTMAVLEWAALLMRRDGAAISLAHVVDTPNAVAAAEAWLARLVRDIRGVGRVTTEVTVGTPGDEIVTAARRRGVDLIVMGRRGRGRVFPGVLGSTVNAVLERANCPVLLVVDSADAILDDWETDVGHADVP